MAKVLSGLAVRFTLLSPYGGVEGRRIENDSRMLGKVQKDFTNVLSGCCRVKRESQSAEVNST